MEWLILKERETVSKVQPYQGSYPPVRKAIILAAGIGKRLGPFTNHTPKCLVAINGVPILINMLTHLSDSGVKEAVIVVGYLKERIYEEIGDSFNGMKVSYIESDCYTTTNNIYSLWLAREHLTEDIILLEADLFFERLLLERMLSNGNNSIAAVAGHQSWMSGTVVSLDKEGNIQTLFEERHQDEQFDYSRMFKTLNIYLFRRDFLRDQFIPALEAFINAGDVNQYYEAVLQTIDYNQQHSISALLCDDIKWFEIDDERDRLTAEYIFASPEERYEVVTREYGSYWRYGFTDHAYLYNLYFPPEGVFTHIRNYIYDLVESYPVGQEAIANLMGIVINQPGHQIVVGNGASELIKIIAGHFCNHLIIPEPSFNEYVNVAPEEKVTRFALKPPSFQLDVDEFAAAAARCKADVAVVVSPNNPTSLLVPKADLLRLTKKLASQNCLLIVDESFIDFVDDQDQTTMEQEIIEHENLAILKSMSKAYGICGLRIGYLLTANQEFAAAVRNEVPIWNINGFAEAFLRLLPHYHQEFIESCRLVRRDRDDLYRSLSRIPGMKVYKPDANFVFCRLPDQAMSGPEITRRLFMEDNIYIKHCAEKPLPESDRYLRIASRTRSENHKLAEALQNILTGRQL